MKEREFEDYKEFMSHYYEDANEWTKQPKGVKKTVALEIDLLPELKSRPSFETESTSGPLSPDTFSSQADGHNEDRNDGRYSAETKVSWTILLRTMKSCYSSDESDEDDDSDDSQSVLSSIISKTASIVMHTMRRIRALPALLGNTSSSVLPEIDESPYRTSSSTSRNSDRGQSPTMSDWLTPLVECLFLICLVGLAY